MLKALERRVEIAFQLVIDKAENEWRRALGHPPEKFPAAGDKRFDRSGQRRRVPA